MAASKVFANWRRWVHLQALFNEIPTFLDVILGASELEVVNVNGQNQLEFAMNKATLPIRKCLKASLQQLCLAMLFPVHSRHGVTVQGKPEAANWVSVPAPFLWLLITREKDPSLMAFELGLGVGLLGIGLLDGPTRKGADRIKQFRGG